MKQTQFNDLARLAVERCRESAMSVAQLMDEDRERAALLMSVATDFIEGAVHLVEGLDEEHEITADEALGAVLAMIFRSIGIKKVMAALTNAKLIKEMPK
jgi:hypothetical protein